MTSLVEWHLQVVEEESPRRGTERAESLNKLLLWASRVSMISLDWNGSKSMAEKRRNRARKGEIPQGFEYRNGTKSKHSIINRNIVFLPYLRIHIMKTDQFRLYGCDVFRFHCACRDSSFS
jgi:hypothetical protein